ncbi:MULTISPECIES: DUF924 family protein [Sphingomonas]|uniref:DUF924 family protein n=1 Tax=Sphingomonas TaxID=13687 RepID=UPI000DEFD1E0|nr:MULTISPECIES: DUF924 family protein [Sphingomonas]
MTLDGPDWSERLLAFWFGLDPALWFKRDDALDAELRRRFERVRAALRDCPPGSFLASPRRALAAVILFDQVPRNLYRDRPEQFATDPLALTIARDAIALGYDRAMTLDERTFLYMPFQHSESLADQAESLRLFTALGDPERLDYARRHHDVIARFGRFPHRNAALGRTPTAAERAAGNVEPF